MSVEVDRFVPWDVELNSLISEELGKASSKNLEEILKAKVGDFFATKIQELSISQTDYEKIKPEIKAKITQINQVCHELVESKKRDDEARRKVEAAQVKIDAADVKIISARAKQVSGLTKIFYAIFYAKKAIPVNEIETIFNTYLVNRSLSVKKTAEGAYPRMNSMEGVTKFLADHPDVQVCDFKFFKAELHDVSTLCNYLKINSTVTKIIVKNNIAEDAKKSFAEAVAARKGQLTVEYLP
jgi:hypothetical protein